jgi:hypothetical protein
MKGDEMNNTVKLNKAECRDLVAAAFPGYQGRIFRATMADHVYVDRIGGGGSWQEVMVLVQKDGAWVAIQPAVGVMQAPCGQVPVWPMMILAVRTHFCGHDRGITFYYSHDSIHAPALLGI